MQDELSSTVTPKLWHITSLSIPVHLEDSHSDEAKALLCPQQHVVENRLIGRTPGWPSSLAVSGLQLVQSPAMHPQARNHAVAFLAYQMFPNPVHPKRWPLVLPAVRERARENGTSPDDELLKVTMCALALVTVEESSSERPFEKEVRRQLNDIVTRDFLGDDWQSRAPRRGRHHYREETWDENLDLRVDGLEDTILGRVYGEELTQRAKLSEGEKQAVAARLAGYTHYEWAAKKGVAPSTVRNQFMSAMQKFRAVIDGGV